MFACNCGSVALFDGLGVPWPKHFCPGAPRHGAHSGPTYGLAPHDASRIVRAFAEARGLEVPPLSWELDPEIDTSVADTGRRVERDPIEAVAPNGALVRVMGVVRELASDVNSLKKLGVTGPMFERQILRKIPARVVQVTLWEAAADGGPIRSYTFWLDPSLPACRAIRKEAVIAAELRPVALPALEPLWLATSVDVLL